MKVLWISHDPIIIVENDASSSSGFWKEALLKALTELPDLNIKVASPANKFDKTELGEYNFRFPHKKVYRRLPSQTINDLLKIINDFKPHLIHIHGTEKPYGLLKKYTNIPIIISLQGFYSESFNSLLGEISLPTWNKEKTFKELILKNSFIDLHKNWFYYSAIEKEIVKINKYFIGRTEFDKQFVYKYNKNAKYFIGYELLRDEFYNSTWDIKNIKRHSIYISSFKSPLKGFHILLEAINYLKDEFPDIRVVVPGTLNKRMINKTFGNSYFRIIKNMIIKYDLENNINFTGILNAKQISEILKETNVFVLPSLIENSSNALGEAQLGGTPCIVSDNCGGIDSIITGDVNGLKFRKGDSYQLANRIKQIFEKNDLAIFLSANSKEFACKFYNKKIIKKQYAGIYRQI